MEKSDENNHGYIIELRQVGDYVKVSAIDPVTLTEVSMIGSPKLTQDQLSQLAVRKLKRVLEKKSDNSKNRDDIEDELDINNDY